MRHTSRLRDAPGIDLDQPQAAADGPADRERDPAARRRQRRLLRLGVAGAVLTFLTLGLLSAYRTTIYRPADEASHIGYGREVGRGRLPRIDTPIPADADPTLARILSRRDAAHQTIWTANHPPLYYTLIAVPLRVGDAIGRPHVGVLAARALSVGLAALGLVALAYVVLQLVPDRPQLAVAAAGFIGLMPSLSSTSGRAAYNDALAFCITTVTMAAVVVFVLRGPSALRLAAVAATAGLAALSRASGLLVAVVAGLAVLAGVWRAGDGGVAAGWPGPAPGRPATGRPWPPWPAGSTCAISPSTATSPGRPAWSGTSRTPPTATAPSRRCSPTSTSGGRSRCASGTSPPGA